MKHKLIAGTGFIGVLLVCAVRAFPAEAYDPAWSDSPDTAN